VPVPPDIDTRAFLWSMRGVVRGPRGK
jgi:hypothetical protein